jgi:predicted ATPase
MTREASALHLRTIQYRAPAGPEAAAFPFSVPAVAALGRLDLTAPVTFFVGENGSGKSTLLEGLAAAAGAVTVGSDGVEQDETLAEQRRLARQLKLTWGRRTHRGFFLRAEDFFGFARRVARLRGEMQQRLAEVERDFADATDWARGLAAGPALNSLHELERRYGVSLDARSHGEGFLKLFQSRLVSDGLYFLDEPEAPLSPQNQLALIAMLRASVDDGSQFVIATHSPILLALPGAAILSFDENPIAAVPFAELEHVRLTREFLADPDRYLRYL